MLPSNTHKGQSPGDFNIHLPHRLLLSGKWEVCLSEFIYPHTWLNLTDEKDRDDQLVAHQSDMLVTLVDGRELLIYVPTGYYQKAQHLIANLNIGIQAMAEAHKQKAITEYANQTRRWNKSQQTGGSTPPPDPVENDARMQFNRDALYYWMSTVSHRVNLDLSKSVVKSVTMSRRVAYMLGFKNQVLDSRSEAEYPTDTRGGKECLYIYSNIVSPQIIGNTLAPLLRLVHISGEHGDIVEKLFTKQHYVPVCLKEIDHIHLNVKSDQGDIVKFTYGKCVAKLHFRKRRFTLE